jgi:hypothetical protein
MRKLLIVLFLAAALVAAVLVVRAYSQGRQVPPEQLSAPAAETAAAPDEAPMANVSAWEFDGFFEVPEIPEPSGLCYCPDTDSIFVVDDGGQDRPPGLYEISLEAQVLRSLHFGKDLEGVCIDPLSGHIFVADEFDERVWIIERSEPELNLLRSFTVSRLLHGEEFLSAGGNGFEGLECLEDSNAPGCGYLLLLNQDDPHAIVRVDLDAVAAAADGAQVEMAAAWELPEINCGEIRLDHARAELWVSHAWQNVAEVLNPADYSLIRWEVLPGAAQEGLAFDGQHRLWIGQDLGGLARYTLK